ncbi:MAG: hypothetical protein CSA62_11085 [Planctomycetota bacterium]|nr:MAG: hypothetical protein CSA62_11085 [Planctomycetota bacterium]
MFENWMLLSGIAIGAIPPLLLRRYPIFGSDHPEGQARKRQSAAIPLAGAGTLGLGSLLLASDALREGSKAPLAFLIAVLLTLVLGIRDDRLPQGLRALPKVLGQAAIGLAVAAALLETHWGSLGLSFESMLFVLGTCFVVMLLQNAWNFFDNFDGAAVWVAGSSCLLILSGAFPSEGSTPLTSALSLRVALSLGLPLLGFLYWNYPRARCYLGDAGSHLLGLGFAYMSLQGALLWLTNRGSAVETLAILDLQDLLAFLLATSALPLLDLVQVSIVRILHRIPPWQADRRHLAHRLEALLPHAAVAPVLAALHLLLAVGSLSLL